MKNLQKIFVCFLILFVGCISAFATSTQRAQIDKFFVEYEAVIAQMEKMGSNYKVADLVALQQKVAVMVQQVAQLQNLAEWTDSDSQKYVALSQRYADVCAKLQVSTTVVAE